MKGGQNLAFLKQKREEEDGWVKPQSCCICGKVIKGAYGHHGDDWTCQKSCEKAKMALPRFPGHSEEQFFKRQGANREVLEMQD
jgi:hypothetical protein